MADFLYQVDEDFVSREAFAKKMSYEPGILDLADAMDTVQRLEYDAMDNEASAECRTQWMSSYIVTKL